MCSSDLTLGAFSAASAAGGVATQTVNVGADVSPGTYSLNLQWANDASQTASCTIKLSVAGVSKIYSIQGSGAASPLVGQTVITSGMVTKVNNNGFFIQDPVGDGDPSLAP